MQWGVREHDTEVGVARGKRGRQHRCVAAAAKENDGGLGGAEQALFKGGDFAGCLYDRERWEHEGEGLFLAVL